MQQLAISFPHCADFVNNSNYHVVVHWYYNCEQKNLYKRTHIMIHTHKNMRQGARLARHRGAPCEAPGAGGAPCEAPWHNFVPTGLAVT